MTDGDTVHGMMGMYTLRRDLQTFALELFPEPTPARAWLDVPPPAELERE